MSPEDQQNDVPTDAVAAPKPAPESRKRPRLDLSAAVDGTRERKRGKSMFGIVLGTLNKAKIEDKERNASEAAKKRQLIDQRLQNKLRKETDSVRRTEEAKKSKTTANRKEEDLQLKDSIYKLRHARHPLLVNFLLTSDTIPSDDSSPAPPNPLAPVPRSHPPPLYYLPAVLLPAQEAFLTRRKAEAKEAADKEWELFKEERARGIEEISEMRQQAADEEAKIKSEKAEAEIEMEADTPLSATAEEKPAPTPSSTTKEIGMVIEETLVEKEKESNPSPKKEEPVPMQADDDDAVEY